MWHVARVNKCWSGPTWNRKTLANSCTTPATPATPRYQLWLSRHGNDLETEVVFFVQATALWARQTFGQVHTPSLVNSRDSVASSCTAFPGAALNTRTIAEANKRAAGSAPQKMIVGLLQWSLPQQPDRTGQSLFANSITHPITYPITHLIA